MQGRDADIPVFAVIIESGTKIDTRSRDVALLNGGVSIVFGKFCLRAIKALAENISLNTHTQSAAKERSLIGVLHTDTFVREESDLVVEQLKTHAVISAKTVERHIAGSIHGLGIVLKARKLHGIGHRYIQFVLLTHRSGIK